ncbi:zf-HC2 domain-containing protein [Actinoplanes sp. NPDC051346]|uniref:zf-HC2 domain-containing protein n=1 Tax=Actinoplanes sp. NPDC051346 TaxID=3155048 RepID=UPI0034141A32
MTPHPSTELISRYAEGATDVDDATVWAVEAHLESCATCRGLLTDVVDPGTRDLLERVSEGISSGIAAGPPPVLRRRRLRRTGVTARVLPWLATAVALMLAAVLFEELYPDVPSLVLLLAPVAPLLPIAASWSRRTDPAWELVATMPRTGLVLLLRRTLAVLAAVIPVLAVAAWGTGHSPAVWLLPCLAFTAGSLALGGLVGLERAALALTVVWSAGVVLPSLVSDRLSALLSGGSWPVWAVITVVLVGLVIIRAGDHRRFGAGGN